MKIYIFHACVMTPFVMLRARTHAHTSCTSPNAATPRPPSAGLHLIIAACDAASQVWSAILHLGKLGIAEHTAALDQC